MPSMRRYSTPTAIISVSPGSTNRPMRGAAKRHTSRELTRQKPTDTPTAERMPLRMRSVFCAPVFWATKVEKALPKSWTGR